MYVALISTCILLHILPTSCEPSTTTTTRPSNLEESNSTSVIDQLQKQKQQILEQLVEALQDGNAVLKENNESIASNDLKHIKELYESLLKSDAFRNNAAEVANTTDQEPGQPAADLANDTLSARRHREVKLHLFDFVALTSKRKKHKQAEKDRNRIIMQGKIDEWLLNRQLEKKKIKNYIDRIKLPKVEDCPRHGVSARKKKKKSRRNEGGEEEGGGGRRRRRNKDKYTGGRQYPCCRKCCKRSYMGCL